MTKFEKEPNWTYRNDKYVTNMVAEIESSVDGHVADYS